MKHSLRTSPFLASALAAAFLFVPVRMAHADEGGSPSREAAQHFQRAVGLYGEADYRSALVEFRRAYDLAPNTAVLYNIAETEFQLQDYAAALTAFESYADQASADDPHRAEVAHSLEVLRTRVGQLSIATSPTGADVTIDDQPVGKTPFAKALVVSIGHRKVTVAMENRPSTTRYVDIAAGDNEAIFIPLGDAAPTSNVGPQPLPSPSGETRAEPPHSSTAFALRVAGWAGTAALALGATASGLVTLSAERDLQNAKAIYPANAATLSSDASRVRGLSILSDTLSASALVLGSVTLISTITAVSHTPHDSTVTPQITLTPGSVRLGLSF